MDSSALVTQVVTFVKAHLSTIVILAFLALKFYMNNKPVPDIEGSKVIHIENGLHWDKVFEQAKVS